MEYWLTGEQVNMPMSCFQKNDVSNVVMTTQHHLHVMDTGISILIYITYAYLYCLQLLLVTLDSAFIGSDHFMIIE
jgi:hypothetical protein